MATRPFTVRAPPDVYARVYVVPAALIADSVSAGNNASVINDCPDVQAVIAEAIGRWEAAGISIDQGRALHNVQSMFTNLGGATLGLAAGNTVWIDDDAAGWGWFVDPTPHDDAESTTPGNQGEQNRLDLLTVISHELGHLRPGT